MIDIEDELFGEISEKIYDRFSDKHPDLFITSEYIISPPSFPCISLVEVDNATNRSTLTSSGQENHAVVMYEVNVYSNKTFGAKAECKEIVRFVDTILSEFGFRRTMLEPIPNYMDSTIYRMLGRYRAIVSKDNVIYRR